MDLEAAGIAAAAAAGDGAGDRELVALALDRLEPRHAEVLRRKYVAGETLEAIARALGLRAATVGTLLHRGKERFREVYERLRARAGRGAGAGKKT